MNKNLQSSSGQNSSHSLIRDHSKDNKSMLNSQLPARVFSNAVSSGVDLNNGVVNISFAGEHLDSTKKDTNEE